MGLPNVRAGRLLFLHLFTHESCQALSGGNTLQGLETLAEVLSARHGASDTQAGPPLDTAGCVAVLAQGLDPLLPRLWPMIQSGEAAEARRPLTAALGTLGIESALLLGNLRTSAFELAAELPYLMCRSTVQREHSYAGARLTSTNRCRCSAAGERAPPRQRRRLHKPVHHRIRSPQAAPPKPRLAGACQAAAHHLEATPTGPQSSS